MRSRARSCSAACSTTSPWPMRPRRTQPAAYARIGPDLHKDPGLLAGYADALASNAKGNLEGEPTRLVQEALRLDPDHPTALALSAMAAYKRHDVQQAARDWQHLLRLLP